MTPMRLTITVDYDGDDPGVMIDWLVKREEEFRKLLAQYYPEDLKYISVYEQTKK